jgi:acyl phosphate:glycerol-3-phosphate acyltransferase
MAWIGFCLFAYLIGSIPVGILLSRLRGIDPRNSGSGNIGATNVMRTAGRMVGILTLIGDIAKGAIPTALAMYTGQSPSLVALTAFMAFIGHVYTLFLRFKGGKGVATLSGIFIVLSPVAIGTSAIVFVLLLMKWRYVSLGSIVGSAMLPVTLYLRHSQTEYVVLALAIALVVVAKHLDNIRRLLAGEEHRFR